MRSILYQIFSHFPLNFENRSVENRNKAITLSSNTKSYIWNSFWKYKNTSMMENFRQYTCYWTDRLCNTTSVQNIARNQMFGKFKKVEWISKIELPKKKKKKKKRKNYYIFYKCNCRF